MWTFVVRVVAVAVGPEELPVRVVSPPFQPSLCLNKTKEEVVEVVVETPPLSVAVLVVREPDHMVAAAVNFPRS